MVQFKELTAFKDVSTYATYKTSTNKDIHFTIDDKTYKNLFLGKNFWNRLLHRKGLKDEI